MTMPKIIPGTFKGDISGLPYDTKVEGTVHVKFGGSVQVCKATYTVGRDILEAHGFVSKTKTGKYVYKVWVRYYPMQNEHDCRIGGGLRSGDIWFNEEQYAAGRS